MEFPVAIPRNNIHVVDSLGEPVGRLWKELQEQYAKDGLFFVACPLSRTPLPIYDWLLENAQNVPGWDKLRFVFMDEQVEEANGRPQYVPIDDPASLEGFGRRHFLASLNGRAAIPEESMILKPSLDNFQAFDGLIDEHQGLDLLILAIGEEGHYAMAMPGTPIDRGYHLADLSQKFIQQHTESGGPYQGSNFRSKGMSLGPKQVLGAKHLVIIISGENKRELTTQLFSYIAFEPSFPLSIIFEPSVKDRVEIYLTQDLVSSPSLH